MLLSRIADAMFWENRYMQRAHVLLRVIANHYILSLEKDLVANITWRPVLEVFTDYGNEQITTLENDTNATIFTLLLDLNNYNSFINIVTHARENARGVQDHITKEVWEEVNGLYHYIHNPDVADRLNSLGAIEVIEDLISQCVSYSGMAEITMPRGRAWDFMSLGQYFERCMTTIMITEKQFEIFDFDLKPEKDIIKWRLLLLSLSGYELYLKTYKNANYNLNVVHQVFFNVDFPHSVMYSLRKIDRYLVSVVRENNSPDNQALLRRFQRLYSRLRYMEIDEIKTIDLKEFVTGIKSELLQISAQLGQNFFSYS